MASIERRQTASGETRWDVRYRDPERRHRARTFHRKADAQKFANVVEADITRGEWLDPQLGRETFGDWADRWAPTIAGLTPKTRESYESILRRHLRPRFEDTPVNRIDHPTVVALIAELTSSGAGAGTVRNIRDVLRLVLELARRSGAIKVNPVEGAKAPKKPPAEMVFLNADQIMTLADEITHPPIRRGGGEHRRPNFPERGLLVRFAGFTGLRSAEVVALQTEAIDLLHGRIHVIASATEAYGKLQFGPPKTYQRRSVPLPQALADEVTTHLAGKASDDFVFTSSRGGPLRHSNFYARHFKPAVIRAGLPEATRFHDLRHSYAAMLIAEGAHPRAIMERLGHSTIQVTLGTYGHVFPNLEAALTDALDEVYRKAEPTRGADVREFPGSTARSREL
jgi:integrase